MFYSLIFWLFVIGAIAVSNRKPSVNLFSSFFNDSKFTESMNRKDYVYAVVLILESLRKEVYGTEQYIDIFFKTLKDSSRFSDKIFSLLSFPLIRTACKKRKHISLYVNIIIIWSWFSYATIQTFFVICLVSTIVLHKYYSKYVYYMENFDIALFYIVPICIFFLITFIGTHFLKKEFGWPLIMVSFIITFCISLPIEIFNNDWASAKEEYNQEMREEFGEDWQDEAESYHNEYMYRRR